MESVRKSPNRFQSTSKTLNRLAYIVLQMLPHRTKNPYKLFTVLYGIAWARKPTKIDLYANIVCVEYLYGVEID